MNIRRSNMTNEENQFDQSDLDWLAFCYVTGELGPQQLEAFETRLSSDQAARESIVRAMRQTQLLQEAFLAESRDSGASDLVRHAIKSAAPTPVFRSAPAWLALAAAVLLIATAWQWFAFSDFSSIQSVSVPGVSMVGPTEPVGSPVIEAERVAEERLANAWVNTIAEDSTAYANSELLQFAAADVGYSDVVFETESWLVEAIENDPLNQREVDGNSADDAESHRVPGSSSNGNLIPHDSVPASEGIF